MFSGITSYIFGASTPSEEEEVPVATETPGNNDEHPDEAKLRLRMSADDSEWVLVDKANSGAVGDLEQNPLEDLLIEHPSMSVYGPRGRPHSTGHDSEDSATSSTEIPAPASRGAGRGVVPRHRTRPLVTSAKAGLQAQVAATRAVQRAQKYHNHKHYSRNAVERNNRVQHHNSHMRRQRRKDHMLHPSGVSNNRKMTH